MRRRTVVLAGLVAALVAVGCGGDDEETVGTPAVTEAPAVTEPAPEPSTEESALPPAESALPPSGDGGELVIVDLAFGPLTVAAGAEFSISNLDGFAHTVTSDTFDVRVDAGGTEALTIDEPGTYEIVCKIHPSMTGTIVVE